MYAIDPLLFQMIELLIVFPSPSLLDKTCVVGAQILLLFLLPCLPLLPMEPSRREKEEIYGRLWSSRSHKWNAQRQLGGARH